MPELHSLLPSIRTPIDIEQLARAIAQRRAVVYAGAGASIPAGLPGWDQFLQECLAKARSPSGTESESQSKSLTQAASLLREGDYLTGAGILQTALGSALESLVWDRFGTVTNPSPVHEAIARIPFSLAITTNYDRLLESAYPNRPNVWTWRDPEALLSSIKHNRFAVVKIHGDVGNGPSLVLTKNQYRDLMHLNRAFNDCIASLLSLRTFLFIGTSLHDRDLIHLLDTAKLTYGAEFGPHYAIAFDDEVDEPLQRHLEDAYNIRCVVCSRPDDDGDSDWRTTAVCSFLTILSGWVAQELAEHVPVSRFDDPEFNLRDATAELVEFCVSHNAAGRGLLAYVKDPGLPSLHCVYDSATSTSREGGQSAFGGPLPIHGDVGQTFVRFGRRHGYSYEHDLFAKSGSPTTSFTNTSEWASVLSCLVESNGKKIGLIAMESSVRDAFSKGHLEFLTVAADVAGAIYSEFEHRSATSKSLEPYFSNMRRFQAVMGMSRQLAPLDIAYLLYEIDYDSGRLVAHYDPSLVRRGQDDATDPTGAVAADVSVDSRAAEPAGDSPFFFMFSDHCFAARVLKTLGADFVEDAQEDRSSSDRRLDHSGVERFGIEGPVFGCPVRVGGRDSAVLVCWSRSPEHRRELVAHGERIVRLATLVANSPMGTGEEEDGRSAHACIERFNELLEPIDGGRDWTVHQIKLFDFRRKTMEAVCTWLCSPPCNLRRVRIWVRYFDEPTSAGEGRGQRRFVICKSLCTNEAGGLEWDKFTGTETSTDDPYCNYTAARSPTDPYAQLQHFDMFGVGDPLVDKLEKDPKGRWFVAPIHSDKYGLVGWVSADNHIDRREQPLDPSDVLFQSCVLDLASDMLVVLTTMIFKSSRKQSPLHIESGPVKHGKGAAPDVKRKKRERPRRKK